MATAALLLALAKRQPPAPLAASLFGWMLIMASDSALIVPVICGGADAGASGLETTLALNAPGTLILAWLAMLLAMMPPLLAGPIAHLTLRSLKRRRFRAVAMFVAGYGALWLAAAPALVVVAIAARWFATVTGLPVLAAAAMIALGWQATPFKQLALNRCHRLPRLSAFGAKADLDCLRYGAASGVWCVGACWALMVLPLVGEWHLPLMAAVMLIALLERSRLARPARWGFKVPPLFVEAFGGLRPNRIGSIP